MVRSPQLQHLQKSASSCSVMSRDEVLRARIDMANSEPGKLNAEDGIDCQACKNRGYRFELESDDWGPLMVMHRCSCMGARESARRMRESGLHHLRETCTFSGFQASEPWQEKLKGAAERFCRDGGASCLFMGGQSGAGKTHLCTAVALHYLEGDRRRTRYVKWLDEAAKIKGLYDDGEGREAAIRELQDIDVLYIDDLFKVPSGQSMQRSGPKPADVRLAFEILDVRLSRPGCVTILSSELTMPEMLEVDESLGGRIAAAAGVYCISIERDMGKNYRLKGVMSP